MTPTTPEAPEFVHGIRRHMLYKANPRDLMDMGARKVNPNCPYDQAYGQFLRVTVAGKPGEWRVGETWMIDTYHISCLSWPVGATKTSPIECLMRMETVTPHGLGKLLRSCYHNDCVRLTEDTAKLFEPFCDLREFEIHTQNDMGHYSDRDVRFGVHLYREHGYVFGRGDIGVSMLRKGAKPEPNRKLARLADHAIDRCRTSNWAEPSVKEFEEYAFEHMDVPDAPELLERVRMEYGVYQQIQDVRQAARPHVDSQQMTIPGLGPDDEEDET